MEDPLDHLDEFDRLCSLTKINGVSEDAFKLRLFPFSLGDKAHQWEKALPQGSITSWDDCKKAFLAKFFSNSRTAKLRNAISSFAQKNGETFCEAWERFKSSTTKCPHHGFSQESLLSTLYRGVLPKFRMMLDTASNGNFLNKDVEDGWELVENLAQSDGNYNEDCDRTVRSNNDTDDNTRKEIKALHEKFDRILLGKQKQVISVCEAAQIQVPDGEVDPTKELCYMQNQGGYNRGFNNYRANPNLSYRSTNIANPQDQVYPQQQRPQQQQAQQPHKPFVPYNQNQNFAPKQQYFQPQQQGNMSAPPGFPPQAPPPDMTTMLQQLLQGQAAGAQDVAKKFSEVQHNFHDLNTKVEALNSKVKYLESNHATTSSAKPQGQLPGKAIQNPKEYHQAQSITLRSGRKLPSQTGPTAITVDSDEQDGEDFCEPEIQAEQKEEEDKIQVQPELQAKPSIEKATVPEAKKPMFIPPPYKPKLPFPGRFKKELVAKYKSLFDKQMKEIKVKMPLLDAIALIPQSHKFLKDLEGCHGKARGSRMLQSAMLPWSIGFQ
ncbi:PREDICTED: uncharacterized protein LOC104768097 [Camelina sativa]|uniref:Uncharacterized protein LOC104768097 n=1 Tax=Camelina sativa TaxID=90675 RepID=A0ABM0XSE9_CAMSA|nr:PREDICTED: uncharacterized protein LOC104768097 [Camelina sativa]